MAVGLGLPGVWVVGVWVGVDQVGVSGFIRDPLERLLRPVPRVFLLRARVGFRAGPGLCATSWRNGVSWFFAPGRPVRFFPKRRAGRVGEGRAGTARLAGVGFGWGGVMGLGHWPRLAWCFAGYRNQGVWRMLVLSRMTDERLVIGSGVDAVVVTVVKIQGDKVCLGVEAPRRMPVDRSEVRARKDLASGGRVGRVGGV